MTPAAGYIRVSSANQADAYGPEIQRQGILEYADEHGLEIIEWFTDTHTGSALWERPEMSKLRAAFGSGGFKVVLVWRMDRLSREPGHALIVTSEAQYHGIELVSVCDPIERSESGELVGYVKAFAARQELNALKARTQSGRRARAKSGKPIANGKPPYGLSWADETKSRWNKNEMESPVVEAIFRAKASGQSLRSIAVNLNASGTPTPAGGRVWDVSTIRHILTNETYTGRAKAWRGQFELPKGVAPRIVSDELFDAAQQALTNGKRQPNREPKDPNHWLLRGHIHCAYCGRALSLRRSYSTHKGKRYDQRQFKCDGRRGLGDTCNSRPSINADNLDRDIWQAITRPLRDPQALVRLVEDSRGQDPAAGSLKTITRLNSELQKKIVNITASLSQTDNEDARAVLISQLEGFVNQRKMLDIQRDELEEQQRAWQTTQADQDNLTRFVAVMAESLDDLDVPTRRLLLKALDVRVRVFKADIKPRWEITASIPLDESGSILEGVFSSPTCRPGQSRAG